MSAPAHNTRSVFAEAKPGRPQRRPARDLFFFPQRRPSASTMSGRSIRRRPVEPRNRNCGRFSSFNRPARVPYLYGHREEAMARLDPSLPCAPAVVSARLLACLAPLDRRAPPRSRSSSSSKPTCSARANAAVLSPHRTSRFRSLAGVAIPSARHHATSTMRLQPEPSTPSPRASRRRGHEPLRLVESLPGLRAEVAGGDEPRIPVAVSAPRMTPRTCSATCSTGPASRSAR